MDKNKSAEITSPDRFNEEFELAEQNLLELDPTGEGSTATELYTGLEWMRDEYKNCFDELTTLQQANAELEKQNAELIGFVKRFHNYTCVQSSGQVRIIDPELVVTEGDQLKYMAQELLIQSHESNKG